MHRTARVRRAIRTLTIPTVCSCIQSGSQRVSFTSTLLKHHRSSMDWPCSMIVQSMTTATVELSSVPWNQRVMSVNHLFFGIFVYLECPALLHFSAVHETWRSRLWPYQLLIHLPVSHDTSQGRANKRKRLRERGLALYRALRTFAVTPYSAPTITSRNANFGAQCSKAVFCRFPERVYHRRRMYKQFFHTYSQIQHLALRFPECNDHRSLEQPAFLAQQLCEAWYESSSVDRRTLEIYGPYSLFLPRFLSDNSVLHCLRVVHKGAWDLETGNLLRRVCQIAHVILEVHMTERATTGQTLKHLFGLNLGLLGDSYCNFNETLDITLHQTRRGWNPVTFSLNLHLLFPHLRRLTLHALPVPDQPWLDGWMYATLNIVACSSSLQELHLSTTLLLTPSSLEVLAANRTTLSYM